MSRRRWAPRLAGTDDEADRVLVELDHLCQQPLEWSELPQSVADLAVPDLADWCVITFGRPEETARQRVVSHSSGESRAILERALQRDPVELNRRHELNAISEAVLSTGQAHVTRLDRGWTLRYYGSNPTERFTLESLTPKWVGVYPLISRGTVIGTIGFAFLSQRPGPDREDQQARFADRIGLILDHARQVDQLKRIQHDMSQVKEQVYSVLDGDVSAVATAGPDWRLTYMNPAAEELLQLNRDRDTGRSILAALSPKAVESPLGDVCRAAIGEGQSGTTRFVESWTGSQRWVEVRAHPLTGGGAALYVRDITQEKEKEHRIKQHEEELREAQKLETIGRLAGGVAHDFNNILMAIHGHTELALNKIDPDHVSRDSLEEVLHSTDRAARLTRQLLAYSRKGTQQRRPVDLSAIVGALESSLLRLVGEDVELSVKYGWDVPAVLADPNQLEQVVLNLAVNARDAMPGGGRLQIDIERCETLDPDVEVPAETPPDGWVRFTVVDTGTGIPGHVLPHIFEPFYTTKSDRSGTGLGLSTVLGIVQQHGGTISVESELGNGTIIRTYLPACPAATQVAPIGRALDHAVTGRAPLREGAHTILVAEDEERVLDFICTTLRDEGYNVLAARNGTDAMTVVEEHEGTIDLLLTDVVMPFMGGNELAARLSKADPNLSVVYMSGYAENVINQNGDVPAGVTLLDKPFTSAHLLAVLHDVLEGNKPALPYAV